MNVRKVDEPAFNEAVSSAMLAIEPQLVSLREVLPEAIYRTDCPDHLFEAVRKEVMNRIGQRLFEQITPPLTADGA